MWDEEIVIRCPACGSVLIDEQEETELWECRYCRGVFLVDWERVI